MLMMITMIMMMMVMKDDDGEDDSGFMIYTTKRPINSGHFYNFPLLGYSNKEVQNHSFLPRNPQIGRAGFCLQSVCSYILGLKLRV